MDAPNLDPIPAASIASSVPDTRHLLLITAAAQANEVRVREILEENPLWTTQHDRDALRQALQKVAARGHLPIVRLLLDRGADVEARRSNEIPALYKAAEAGRLAVVTELLARGADPNVPVRSRIDQTALFVACFRGHNDVVAALLDGGADVRCRDKLGRTPLLYLVSEKTKGKWSLDTLRLLLNRGRADLEARDNIGRTALLWAATNGNLPLVAALLDGTLSPTPADVSAANNRGRSSLHLAAAANHEAMVHLLLQHNAAPNAMSDGGWTALHNAVQRGHDAIVQLLLDAHADVNAELSNGMTPLHWAAFNGHATTVRLLLERDEMNLDIKDTFDRTPMLCAAEGGHREIVHMLSPVHSARRLSPAARAACENFRATVVDFGHFSDGSQRQVFKPTVFDVLYGWDETTKKPKVDTQTKNIKYHPNFRWIHLPANNIAWVETLLSKWFIESGHRDIESFKALEKCFDQEHRGPLAHAHFMRTFCHRITSLRPHTEEKLSHPTMHEEMTNLSVDPTAPSIVSATTTGLSDESAANDATTPKKIGREATFGSNQDNLQGHRSKRKGKAEAIAERHPRKAKRGNGPPGNPPGTKALRAAMRSGATAPVSIDTANLRSHDGKVVLFMPFLHYETDERRQRMSHIINLIRQGWEPPPGSPPDVMLMKGYLQNTPPLHPRRTLDQFFYHGIDTSLRDMDQVVYRYCKRHNIEKKVFMVDQLWLWVLGKDLIVTCCPQRWDQPGRDPLNVVDGIIEETNAETRPPILSVYDLAMVITHRCSVMFDRYRLADQSLQFLDMFESSIGLVTNTESELFSRFNKASELSAEWLELHRHTGRRLQPGLKTSPSSTLSTSSPSLATTGKDGSDALHITAPVFPDALLDIGTETSLLAEIKDIRDELNILAGVLSSQMSTLDELQNHLLDELQPESGASVRRTATYNAGVTNILANAGGNNSKIGSSNGMQVNFRVQQEVRKRSRDQRRLLEVHHKDIERMDRQAESIYLSLTHLLDLKQKHSNALEARFARDHAMIAARQGQTIMTFTIVTILFLPMSFIAAFFSIQITDWERDLTLRYVSKYMFGIGLGISIPLILMAFTVSDILDAARNVYSTFANHSKWFALNRRHRAGHAASVSGPVETTGKSVPLDTDNDSLATVARVKKLLMTGSGAGSGVGGSRNTGSHGYYASPSSGHGVVLHQSPVSANHLQLPTSTYGGEGGSRLNVGSKSISTAEDPTPDLEKGAASSYTMAMARP